MEQLAIERIYAADDVYKIMQECDNAFERSVTGRGDFASLYGKISKYAVFLRATLGNCTAGYAAMYANDLKSGIAYITLICVKKAFRRRHIGDALLNMCEFEAKNNGMSKIRLEVRNANTGAVAFYKKNGFETEKECSDESSYMIKEL